MEDRDQDSPTSPGTSATTGGGSGVNTGQKARTCGASGNSRAWPPSIAGGLSWEASCTPQVGRSPGSEEGRTPPCALQPSRPRGGGRLCLAPCGFQAHPRLPGTEHQLVRSLCPTCPSPCAPAPSCLLVPSATHPGRSGASWTQRPVGVEGQCGPQGALERQRGVSCRGRRVSQSPTWVSSLMQWWMVSNTTFFCKTDMALILPRSASSQHSLSSRGSSKIALPGGSADHREAALCWRHQREA